VLPPAIARPVLSLIGTSRHFVATQQYGRFRSEADIQRAAPSEPNLMSTRPLAHAGMYAHDNMRKVTRTE
jgi:hypothetical protein